MAHIYPGDCLFEDLEEVQRETHSRTVEYEGLIWRRKGRGKDSYFESVDVAPKYPRNLSRSNYFDLDTGDYYQ